MKVTKTLYVSDRTEWRAWLQSNYKTEREIWLIYYHKDSGKPRISYNDAVEEALCFGWIDSTVKNIDEEKYAQRFSPRNTKTAYSQMNKERLRRLIASGKVMPEVLASIGDLSNDTFKAPQDILDAIQADPAARANFQKMPERYKRIRIAFIDGARNRPQEFQKRLNYFIKMTAKNKQFGFNNKDYFADD